MPDQDQFAHGRAPYRATRASGAHSHVRPPAQGEFGEDRLADGARLDAPAVGEPGDNEQSAPVAVVVPGLAQAGQPLAPGGR
ncbi:MULTISPECIES: hypothetical protein [unclassified Streptomyces]|uniref:hypothetical protein n=1 Tax=unclassified Streptomyces TaxID=2593676 RepID=UPI00161C96F1|nr:MULTISPECIES: hypothetical protein [unclassified Streptomyces]